MPKSKIPDIICQTRPFLSAISLLPYIFYLETFFYKGRKLYSPLSFIFRIFNNINNIESNSKWRVQDGDSKIAAISILKTS